MALPKCTGNLCSVLHKLVVESTQATHYRLDLPANPGIKLKPAAFAKRELKSPLLDEAKPVFDAAARAEFMFDFGNGVTRSERAVNLGSCPGKKCACVATPMVRGKSIVVDYQCSYTNRQGQSFILLGTVTHRMDSILSVCSVKKDAFLVASTFGIEIIDETIPDLTAAPDLIDGVVAPQLPDREIVAGGRS